MKKRILSIFLAVVMVILAMPSAFAADTTLKIKAEDVEIKKGTTTVEVDIEITENPGVATLGFDVSYDSSVLTLKSMKNGVIFADDEIDSNTAKNPFIVSAICGTGNKTAKGVLVTLEFEVDSTCPAGTYSITLSENAILGGYYNYNEQEVAATLTSGSVTVSNPGSVSGTVKSFGDTSKETTIELVSGSTTVATQKITGNTGNYSFDAVEAGSYTVRVSKSKHATREYSVTVTDGSVTQNTEIWLYGDVNVDGSINNIDILHVNRKIVNQSSALNSATDKEYREKVANVTAIRGTDTILNNTDVLHLTRKVANLSSAFDSLD